MKKMMTKIQRTLAYFFTPEDSTVMAGEGNISFGLNSDSFSLGSLKVLFWVGATMGAFYLITLI
ncbi:MAG TPA: hypothetical protein DHV36_19045 [Desulfobacteraceae bacterium]|nr:hypothetical protein [Desulfobacteraceae bacterium]